MGCDIHMYVERRKTDGAWEPVKGPNPRIAVDREIAAMRLERGDEAGAQEMEAEAQAIEVGTFRPVSIGETEEEQRIWYEEHHGPTVYKDWVWDGRNYDLFAILADVRNGYGFAGIRTGEGFNPISKPRGLPQDVSDYVKVRADEFGCDGHSHSCHTLKDLLDYDWEQRAGHEGMVDEAQYAVYRERGKPEAWCGEVSGRFVSHLTHPEMDALIRGELPRRQNVQYVARVAWGESYRESAGDFYTEAIPALQALACDDPTSVRIVFWFDN